MKTLKGRVARVRALLKSTPDGLAPRQGCTRYRPARYAYLEEGGMARAAHRL
ncbi:hypothetical protein [Mycobacterium riyadhense]|uniref:Uncharacterized protein n=1 Tax=Mycobacterium riyadhense TaxID=486698 RepID=A0A653EPJ2_9MYCO|nr:hypothetical protein [Mycobacterium riyadhense]MCV7144779.1 hypothetical protein [Mycobacterium riyadhense]VTO99222.1 hypothetical protein BIN_B_02952 [Mycobacterium riyadhense]